MKTCYIMGALPSTARFVPARGDLVIAADGGLANLEAMGIRPHVILGDFDSLGRIPSGKDVMVYPVEKDDTDTMLACKLGIARGYRNFKIYGGIGGRLDHTLANIQTLLHLREHGADAMLVGDGETLRVIRNQSIRLPARKEGLISIFAVGGDAKGVTIQGLYYEEIDFHLRPSFPLGVSNHFCGKEAFVEVKEGALLIYEETTNG